MSVVAPHSSNTFNTVDAVVIYPTFSDKKRGATKVTKSCTKASSLQIGQLKVLTLIFNSSEENDN